MVDVKELPDLIGKEVGVSDWVKVDQDRIDRFAELCGDHQWIHVDVERANREIGGTIAHGFLTMSLMSTMSAQIMRWSAPRSDGTTVPTSCPTNSCTLSPPADHILARASRSRSGHLRRRRQARGVHSRYTSSRGFPAAP
jgi:MaoC like domain